uniref:Rhomboid family protein n=1 Tax=Solibacter usitatus (strain Ellin6076) TaxID=234267 RepID=Q02C85_SOLUE
MMELMDPRRMCPHCRAFITTKDRVCPYCNEAVAPRQVSRDDSSALVAGFISHLHFNTTIILLMNIGLYIVTAVFSLQSGNSDAFFNLDGRTLIAFGAKFDPLLAQGEWWRLVTAGFLHGGMLHIFMNTWALFGLGAQVEETFGSSRMWVIYFVATVTGFYASAVWSPALSVGASAGIFGLLGAMIAFGVRHHGFTGDAFRSQYMFWAGLNLLFGILGSGRIDNAAHIGGLIGGFAVAYMAGSNSRRPWEATAWMVAAIGCVLLTALSFLKMYLWFARHTQ